MKTLFSFSGMMAIFGLTMSAFAQTQSTTSSNTSYIETSKFIGRPVKSAQGDQIGTVKDIVLDRNKGAWLTPSFLLLAEAAVRASAEAAKWSRSPGLFTRRQPIRTFLQ
jgi:PRC-barrel domain